MRTLARRMSGAAVAAILLFLGPTNAMADSRYPPYPIGPYALPFYQTHGTNQGYGVTSFSWEWLCSKTVHKSDCLAQGQAYWHSGIDFDLNTIGTDIASTMIGWVGQTWNCCYDGQGPDQNGYGNFVYIRNHTTTSNSTRFTLYYHLTHNGILVSTDDTVSAGQHIAESGNTGSSTAPHLHYSLYPCQCQDGNNDMAPQFTTNPARLPWNGDCHSHALASPVHLVHNTIASFWIKCTNTGGLEWSNRNGSNTPGRMDLYSTTSAYTTSQASLFAGSDWLNTSAVGWFDGTSAIAIGTDATFSFTLDAHVTVGSYPHNYFGLHVYAETWVQAGAGIDVPIVVDPNCAIEAC
jgi:murein DD-endopeptidase MepM/ murein hydrolase activator NlpD